MCRLNFTTTGLDRRATILVTALCATSLALGCWASVDGQPAALSASVCAVLAVPWARRAAQAQAGLVHLTRRQAGLAATLTLLAVATCLAGSMLLAVHGQSTPLFAALPAMAALTVQAHALGPAAGGVRGQRRA